MPTEAPGLFDDFPDPRSRGTGSCPAPAPEVGELRLPSPLRLDPDLSIFRPGHPTCDLVEGDNLAVLTTLQESLRATVDCVYVDPPYNTGSQGFAYDDRIDPGSSHRRWVAFMRERLAVVPDLLATDGAFFVSIDDNEQARLRLLCDEVFGEKNFVAQFVWHKTRKGKALSRLARQVTEYVLCYAKDRPTLSRRGMFGMEAIASLANPLGHRPNAPRELHFPAGVVEAALPDGDFAAGAYGDAQDTLSITVREPFRVVGGRIATPFRVFGRFRWTQATLEEQIAAGTRFAIRDGKFRLVFFRETGHKAPSSLLDDRCGVGTYEEATEELAALVGPTPFVYPKPVSLVRYLVRSVTWDRPRATVLDFFAGAATTGHAVAALNSEDGGHRRSILVTDNSGRSPDGAFVSDAGDSGICRAVARRRLSAVIDRGLPVQLRYYRAP